MSSGYCRDMSTEAAVEEATEPERSPIVKRDRSLFRFDAHNPRLVEDPAGPGLTQDEAALALLDDHDPIAIARSMARFGFFETDPLIAREIGEPAELEVLEGNRRLLAAQLLTDANLRAQLDVDEEYDSLATQAATREISLDKIPVMVVKDRSDANAVIGFRHIVGIKRWPAHEKAAFVARLLHQLAAEGSEAPYDDVAVLTGEDAGDVRRYVRNYRALRQAQSEGLDVTRARESFGALTYAFSVKKIAQFVQLIAPSSLPIDEERAYSAATGDMRILLSLLFGDSESQAAVTDSRRYGDLGRVLEVPNAREKILATRQLDEALALTDALRDRTLKEIRRAHTAVTNVQLAFDDGKLEVDETLWDELRAIEADLQTLVASIGAPVASATTTDGEGVDIEGEDDDDEPEADVYEF